MSNHARTATERFNDKQAVWYFSAVLIILLVATALRTLSIHDVPPGIVRDETLNSDIARFIRDGRFELFFREGFGHEPLYHYLAAPFAPLLGDNVLAVRLPSVYLGILLIAAVIGWTKRWFGSGTALLAGALLAVSWWPIIFSRIGLRPILEPLLLMLALLTWQKRPWLAGVFLGLAVYAYTAARLIWLWPLFVFAAVWSVGRLKPNRDQSIPISRLTARYNLTPFLIALGMYLPLAYTLWQDPSLQERVNQLRGPLDRLAQGEFAPLMQSIVSTLGVFSFTGDPLWSYVLPGTPIFDPITSIGFYIGLVVCLWGGWSSDTRLVWRAAVVLGWLGLGLAPSALAPDSPSFVRLIGVMPLAYIMAAYGFTSLWGWLNLQLGDGAHGRMALTGTIFALLLIGANAARSWSDAQQWLAAPDVREKYQSVWLDMAGYWRANDMSHVVIADSWFEPVKADSFRLNTGTRPDARWVQQGQALVWPLGMPSEQILVPEFAPIHPQLSEWLMPDEQTLAFRSQNYPSFAAYHLGPPPAVFEHEQLIEQFMLPSNNAGDTSLLKLVAIEDEAATELNGVYVKTYWEVTGSLPADASIFIHVIDLADEIVTQHDGLDAAAVTLQPGDVFVQLHPLPNVAADLSNLRFRVGVYLRNDGRRLPTSVGEDFLIMSP